MHQFGSIIGGTQVESGQWIDVHNPFTGQQVGRVAAIAPAKADAVLRQTHAAKFDLSRYDRARILNEMAAAIESRRDEVAHLITAESGLCLKDTTYEASRVCDVLRFAAIKALDDDSAVFPCDISQNGRRRRIYTTRQPLHLIAAITPFNHPMNQVVHKIAPAIATANAVVLKPSEQTPLAAYYLAQLALDCGLPADMLNVINGPSPAIPDLLVKHELVDLVTFTGSSAIGRSIAERAGYKRLVLELGGSSALLVLQDADVEEAANITVAGLYKNSGQRCTAIRRILVHRSLADAFATVLTAKTAALKYGDPYDPANDMGTVISETAANAIEQRVANAISNGATLLIGHKRDGALYAPPSSTTSKTATPSSPRRPLARSLRSSASTPSTKPSPSPTTPPTASPEASSATTGPRSNASSPNSKWAPSTSTRPPATASNGPPSAASKPRASVTKKASSKP